MSACGVASLVAHEDEDAGAVRDKVTACAEADQQDIADSLRGDGNAYGRLVRRYQSEVAGQMRRFSRDPAVCEELVHDVFVEAYISLGKYRGTAPWLNWLRKIAVRVGYRHWSQRERKTREVTLSDEDWQCIRGAVDLPIETSEAAELVHQLLAQLPPRDRLILTLVYLDGCSMAEAASRGGWTVLGAKLQAFRARKKLRKLIEKVQK